MFPASRWAPFADDSMSYFRVMVSVCGLSMGTEHPPPHQPSPAIRHPSTSSGQILRMTVRASV